MNPKQYFFVRLVGTRAEWPDNMTAAEERIMGEHFEYLKKLVGEQRVVAAGPVLNPTFGLIILRVDSEADARHIMAQEPSVAQGVHNYELQPMILSLLMEHRNPNRYPSEASDRILRKETIVATSRSEVWRAWTTSEGAATFFAPAAQIELKPGGKFEIYFGLQSPEGSRGSEDCRVLSYLPEEMLSFEWNAPPNLGELRFRKTQVIISLQALADGRTKVALCQLGWGKGKGWDELYQYFDRAWSSVLANLEKRFSDGPLDWSGA